MIQTKAVIKSTNLRLTYYFISLLTIAVFHKIFFAQYLNGDELFTVLTNPVIKMPFTDAVTLMFTHFLMGDYMPLFQLSFWTENFIFGLNPTVSHVINLGLHLANIFLLIKWLNARGYHLTVVFFVSLVFAMHPVQLESVFWVNERKGLMASFFLLLALINYQKMESTKHLIFSALFFTISLLCKTFAILLPLILFFDLFQQKRIHKKVILFTIITLAIAALTSYIRMLAQKSYIPDWATFKDLNLINWLISLPTSLGHYFKTLFLPLNLSLMYPLQSQYTFVGIDSYVFIAAVTLLVIIYYYSTTLSKKNLIFSLMFFFLLLFPVLNIVPRGNFVNDRYLYFPIIFIFLIFFNFIFELRISLKIKYAIAAFTCLFFMFCSHERSEVWLTSESIWLDTVTKNPQSQTALNNLALTYRNNGDYERAIYHLESALLITSDDITPKFNLLMNLAELYLDKSKTTFNQLKGIFYFNEAKKYSP